MGVRRTCQIGTPLLLLALFSGQFAGAQSFELPGLEGGQLSSERMAGRTAVIIVWAGWSPRCRDVVARGVALRDRLAPEVMVSLVNFQEDADAVRRFLGRGSQLPVFLDRDGSFSKQFEVLQLPGLIVLERGQVRYKGPLPSSTEEALSLVHQP